MFESFGADKIRIKQANDIIITDHRISNICDNDVFQRQRFQQWNGGFDVLRKCYMTTHQLF